MRPPLSVDVIVPSYRRPGLLARCLDALRAQTVEPDGVILVARHGDLGTLRAAGEAAWPSVRVVEVDRPGVVAALSAGVAASTADVVAFTDDDAAPRPGWIEGLLLALADPDVAAAGGRDILPGCTEPRRSDVGRLSRWGRPVGNHHLGTGPARDVDVLKGVNMAVRAERLALPAPGVLRGLGAEVYFELLVCRWAARGGYRVVYDPAIEVDHAPAARLEFDIRRRPEPAAVRAAAHNLLVSTVALDRGRLTRQAAYCMLFGTRGAPGLGRAVVGLGRGELDVLRRLWPSVTGFALAFVRLLRPLPDPMVPCARLRARPPLERVA